MPTKRVIVLERLSKAEDHAGEGTPQQWQCALWADVPVARQSFYQDASKTSQWKGASVTENDNLKTGLVVEKVIVVFVRRGAGLVQVQQDLQDAWQAWQDEISGYNPWLRYGSFWDGAGWTLGGVL